MVIKIKEISIGRGRKWAWDYGNAVGFNISVTIEGTTAKDTVVDMIKRALVELGAMEIGEQERCRNVYDIAQLEENREYKEKVDEVVKITTADGYPVEKLENQETVKKLPKGTKKIPANGKYKLASKGCNKCGGHITWDGWVKGSPPIHIDANGKLLGNGDCPEYDGGGS